jgi:hypothetical protein
VRAVRCASVGLIVALLLIPLAVAWGAQSPKVKTVGAGQTYCPARTIVNNKIAVKQGACYTLFVMRDAKRTYLAFAAKDAKLAAGQAVPVSSAAGAAVVKKIRFKIPIRPAGEVVPVGAIRVVGAKVEDYGARVVFTLLGTPVSGVMVTFSVAMASGKK